VIAAATKMALNLDVSYQGEIPEGPKIWVANHPTTMDPLMLISIVPEKMSVLTTGGAFGVPVIGRYLRHSGHIPVVRGSGQNALDKAAEYLLDGRSVGIFPEGALSPMEGGFKQPRTGAARLALASGVPVIPLGISLDRSRLKFIGTYIDGQPALGHFYFSGPYAVTVGKPLAFTGVVGNRSLVRDISSQIMSSIIQLSLESSQRLSSSPVGAELQPEWASAQGNQYA
jgi:1-acyl-sn-glycerol-3-phosphate acyltransferase